VSCLPIVEAWKLNQVKDLGQKSIRTVGVVLVANSETRKLDILNWVIGIFDACQNWACAPVCGKESTPKCSQFQSHCKLIFVVKGCGSFR